MKNKVFLSVLLMIVLIVPTKIKAISFSAVISGDDEVEVGKTIQLKNEYVVGNDECGTPDCSDIGEVSRDDITTKSTWSSSNTEVATVDQNGLVTGKKAGKVTITATGRHPEREDESALEREATHEIEVIETTPAEDPSPTDNPNTKPTPAEDPSPAANPNTKPTNNTNATTVAVPSTKAEASIYIAVLGSLFILLSTICFMYIVKKSEKKEE